jgi:ferredoxin-NADP reductase
MAMLRHHARADAATRSRVPVRLLYSARTWDDVIFRDELARAAEHSEVEVAFTLTRDPPAGWSGYRRRIDRPMLDAVSWPPDAGVHAFVCGPTPLVESVATLLVELGHDPRRIRTERFGPTG